MRFDAFRCRLFGRAPWERMPRLAVPGTFDSCLKDRLVMILGEPIQAPAINRRAPQTILTIPAAARHLCDTDTHLLSVRLVRGFSTSTFLPEILVAIYRSRMVLRFVTRARACVCYVSFWFKYQPVHKHFVVLMM